MTPEGMSRRLEAIPQVMAVELMRAMTTSLILIEGDARTLVPHDTRRLAGSITHVVQGSGLQLVGSVGPSVGYGVYVEYGRKAGARMPPVQALMGWVQRHFHAPRQRVTQATLYAEALRLARAIKRRGIPPRPFMKPAYDRNAAQISKLFEGVGASIVATITRDGGATPL